MALIGRDEPLAVLASFVNASASDGGALLILGEPGLGKTALLDAAVSAASGQGVRVLRAAGAEFESDVSYAALNQLLLPVAGDIQHLTPGHATALSVALGFGDGPVPDRLMVATAVLMLLMRVAEQGALVVVVDDLPWVDRASAVVLGFLARRLGGTRVGLVAAQRTGEEGFFERAGIPELVLRPLPDDKAGELIAARFPLLVGRTRQRIVGESGGNPLALLELSRERGGREVDAHAVPREGLHLNRRLHGLFASRVAALPQATGRLMLLAALDGTGDARIMDSGVDGPTMNDLGPAERLDLLMLDRENHRLVFGHPLIRSSVVELATSSERREAHRLLAEVFGDDPDASTRHLAEATIEPDERVAARVEESAYRMLRRGDAVATVAMLLRAAELSPSGADRGRRLAHAAYVGADVTGNLAKTPELLERARQADPSVGGSLPSAIAASHMLLNGDGDIDTAHRLLVGAMANALGSPVTEHDVVGALNTLMLVCFWGGRDELWEPFDRAMQTRRTLPLTLLAVTASLFGDPTHDAGPALEELDRLIASSSEEADPARIVQIGFAATFADRIDGCRSALLRVIEDGRQGGALTSAVYALQLLASGSLFAGRWEQAERLSQEALEMCVDLGYPILAWTPRWIQAQLAAMRGEGELLARRDIENRQWAIPRQIRAVTTLSTHAAQLAALGLGDHQGAYELVTTICEPGAFPRHQPFALWTFLDLVEAAMMTGRAEAARAHVTAAKDIEFAGISSRMALHFAAALAMVAADDRAADLFEDALAVDTSHDWPFDRARVELLYGSWLRRAGQGTAARVHLGAASEVFERLGARPWVERCRAEARTLGDRRSAPAKLAAGLTAQEYEIAMMAATGLSNREIGARLFVSPRTVGAHLYRVFPKLGISSRAGLRDALDAVSE